MCVVSTVACDTQLRVFPLVWFWLLQLCCNLLFCLNRWLFKPLVVSFSCLEYLVFQNNCFPCDQCWYFKFLYLHVGSLHIHFFIVLTEDNDPSKSSVSSGAALDAILLRLPTCVNKDFIDEVSRRIVWKLPSGFCANFMRIRRISLEKRKIALQGIMYQWNSVKVWFCQDKREEYIIV